MPASDPPVPVAPGDVLAGKYVVEQLIGQGGMGVVVRAHHVALDERVAIKFLLPKALESPDAVTRFLREARAAVKVKSEHVARVIDVGQLETGAPYMVMEYLEGGDLADWVSQRGVLPVETAIDFVLQACEALADAHAMGIVHRDLKPANLFCVQRSDGELAIKVLDFGISKVMTPGAQGHDLTSTSALMGSPLYMSPEQITTLETGQYAPKFLAVTPTAIYWASGYLDPKKTAFMTAGLGGGQVTTLATDIGEPHAMALAGGAVLLSAGSNVLEWSIDAGVLSTLASGQGTVNALAVDSTSVYWASEENGQVLGESLDGGGRTVLASGVLEPFGVAIDGKHVYFTLNAIQGIVAEAPR